MHIIWTDPALEDFEAIRHYSQTGVGNPHAAVRVGRAIIAAGDALGTLPRRGQRQPDGTYEFPVQAYPQYRLIYDIDEGGDCVLILHVETQLTVPPRPVGRG